MSVEELIKELNALPLDQRMEVVDAVLEADDSWIPESFKRGMADAEVGRFADMDAVLSDAPPPVTPAGKMKYRFKPTENFYPNR